MMTYRKESNTRSLLKGITWRLVAMSDTILIVLLITCLSGHCSLDNAIKIGLIETLLKLVGYFIHERIWQRSLSDGIVTKKETLYKTISWRVIATTMTFIISGTVLNAFDEIILYIALTELFTKFVLYYLHERLWLRIPLGKIRTIFFKAKK
jgi:uncharacterized membrane protein